MITIGPTELVIQHGQTVLARGGRRDRVRVIVVPERAAELDGRQYCWLLPQVLALFCGHCLSLSNPDCWDTLAASNLGMVAREMAAQQTLELFWLLTDDHRALTSASATSIGITRTGRVGVSDPGVLIEDVAGVLARNTAFHLMRVAIELATGHALPVLGSSALFVNGGAAFFDHLVTLKGPILWHEILE